MMHSHPNRRALNSCKLLEKNHVLRKGIHTSIPSTPGCIRSGAWVTRARVIQHHRSSKRYGQAITLAPDVTSGLGAAMQTAIDAGLSAASITIRGDLGSYGLVSGVKSLETNSDLLAFCLDRPLHFNPGAGYRYSTPRHCPSRCSAHGSWPHAQC